MNIEKTTNGKRKKNGHATTEVPRGDAPPPAEVTIDEPKTAKSASAKDVVIVIPKIEVTHTTITVVGISPLIVHAWSEKAKGEMRDKQTGVAKAKKAFKIPEQDFHGARYRGVQEPATGFYRLAATPAEHERAVDCVPALAFKNAAVEAGVLAGVFKTTLRKAFFVRGELLPIISDPPVMREDMVRVGMGTADLRYRPEYRNWSVNVPVEFNPRIISAEQLVNLFDNSGYSIGICEWRPERDGQFGRYRVRLG